MAMGRVRQCCSARARRPDAHSSSTSGPERAGEARSTPRRSRLRPRRLDEASRRPSGMVCLATASGPIRREVAGSQQHETQAEDEETAHDAETAPSGTGFHRDLRIAAHARVPRDRQLMGAPRRRIGCGPPHGGASVQSEFVVRRQLAGQCGLLRGAFEVEPRAESFEGGAGGFDLDERLLLMAFLLECLAQQQTRPRRLVWGTGLSPQRDAAAQSAGGERRGHRPASAPPRVRTRPRPPVPGGRNGCDLGQLGRRRPCRRHVIVGQRDLHLGGQQPSPSQAVPVSSAKATAIEAAAPRTSPRASRTSAMPGRGAAPSSAARVNAVFGAGEVAPAQPDLADLGEGLADVGEVHRLHGRARPARPPFALGPSAAADQHGRRCVPRNPRERPRCHYGRSSPRSPPSTPRHGDSRPARSSVSMVRQKTTADDVGAS